MGKRALLVLSAVILLITLGASAAHAQYAPPSTVPGRPPEGCPPQNPPEDAPCHPRARANVSDDEVETGDEVTVSTEDDTFEEGSDAEVWMSRVRRGSPVHSLGTAVVRADGSVIHTFVVPAVEDGVYLVWIHGVDENGNPVTPIAAIVVDADDNQAAATGVNSSSVDPPDAVASLQTVSPAAEAAAVEAVANGATLSVDNGSLEVLGGSTSKPKVAASGLSTTGADLAAPITVGAALLLTGTGLLLLRNRRRATAQ